MKSHRGVQGLVLALGLLAKAAFVAISGAGVALAQAPNLVPVLVRFEGAPGKPERDLVRAFGGTVNRSFQVVPALAATVPQGALEALSQTPGVAAIEPDVEVQGHASAEYPWGVLRMGCEPLHLGTFVGSTGPNLGTGVKVAVVDSGIDYNHIDLAAAYAGGYDFLNNDADPLDDNGHGTHVSGTIAAQINNAAVIGVAPGVDLYALKVLGANGSGSFSAILAALDWCIANQIQVANFSLGTTTDPGTTVATAFDNAAKAGLVIIGSAGNSGAGVDTVGFPARYPSVIAISSTTSTDTLSSFSSTGPTVELAAPGSDIYSTLVGGGVGYMSGTSMAAPHVTGVAALVIATGLGDLNGNGLVNDEVRAVLQQSATDLGTTGRDNSFGFGLVNAKAAVELAEAGGGTPPERFDAPTNLAASLASRTLTLGWTDNANCETAFEIEQGTTKNGVVTWKLLATTAADIKTWTFTASRGTFRYRVRARKGASTYTAYSNEVSVTVR
ncbi:MAG: S8 family peptidase [Planctomycetaceae bacterium]